MWCVNDNQIVCVIVYCFLGLCGQAEIIKIDMAENDNFSATSTSLSVQTVIERSNIIDNQTQLAAKNQDKQPSSKER